MAKRTPCGSKVQRVGTGGGCYQHKKSSEAAIPIFNNITKLTDYAEVPNPDGIAPFPRPNSSDSWPICAPYPSDCVPPDPPCGEYRGLQTAGGTIWLPSAGFPSGSGTQVDLNSYSDSGTTEDRSTCRKLGFKVVQSAKVFHGQHGLMSESIGAYTRAVVTSGEGPCDDNSCCGIQLCRDEQMSPDQTKYLTKSASATMSLYEEDGTVQQSHSASQTISVNPNSGLRTIAAYAMPDPCEFNSFPNVSDHGLGEIGDFISVQQLLARISNYGIGEVNGVDVSGSFVGLGYGVTGTTSCTETSWSNFWNADIAGEETGLIGQPLEEVTNDFHGHCSRKIYASVYSSDGSGSAESAVAGLQSLIEVTISNTSVSWRYRLYSVNGAGTGTYLARDYQATCTLSGAWTGQDVYVAAKALAAQWSLSDDKTCPWRVDGFLTVAPLVTRNEPPNAIAPSLVIPPTVNDLDDPIADCNGLNPDDDGWVPTYGQVLWTDPQAEYYDGSIRGAPNPAGYAGHFDWRHQTWRYCFDPGLGQHHVFPAYSGAQAGANPIGDSTDIVVPTNAKQWTNNAQAAQIPPGNGVYYFVDGEVQFAVDGFTNGSTWGNGVLVLQKMVQTKIPRPSENFARPCGLDRFAIDETKAGCIAAVDESDPLHPVVTMVVAPLFSSGAVLLDSDSGSNGVWSASSVSGNDVTLSGKVADLPSNYVPRVGGILGPMRWPTAPGFCGRLNLVSATQSGGVVDIVLSEDADLWVGDSLDFTNTGSLGSSIAVASVTDTKHFSVTGTLGAYVSGGSIIIHGATSEDWNDSETKGDLVYAVYEQSLRDFRERARVRALSGDCQSTEDEIRAQQAANGYPQQVSNLTLEQIGPGAGCKPWSVCNPQVYGASPNGEVFDNGLIKPFPETFAIDSVYGANWQSDFYQHVPSAFTQRPFETCDEDFGLTPWSQDSGVCAEDGLERRYYPHFDRVEARVEQPAGSPTLPVTYGFLSFAEIQSATPPDGLAAAPPAHPDYDRIESMPPRGSETPWGLFLAQKGCVCADGRFKDQYAANMVECDRICPP